MEIWDQREPHFREVNEDGLTYVVDGRFLWHMFRNRCKHVDVVLRGEQRPTKIGVIAY